MIINSNKIQQQNIYKILKQKNTSNILIKYFKRKQQHNAEE